MEVKFNISALNLGNSSSRVAQALQRAFERAASEGVESPQDQVSLAIQSVNAQMRGFAGTSIGLNQAFGVTQTLDYSLTRMNDILLELREISASASTAQVDQLGAINSKINSLVAEFSQIEQTSRFENLFLLNGSRSRLNILLDPLSGDSIDFDLPQIKTSGFESLLAKDVESFGAYGQTRIVGDNNGEFSNLLNLISGSGSGSSLEAPNFVNVGTGVFAADQTIDTSFDGNDYRIVDAADFDGDGHLDLLYQGSTGASTSYGAIGLGNGDGTFQAIAATFDTSGSLAIEDIDGDGDIDLLVGSKTPGQATTFLDNDGSGSFSSSFTFSSAGARFTLDDVNNDGDLDYIGTNTVDQQIEVRLGNGDGSFAAEATVAVSAAGSGFSPRLADFDQDGFLDIVVGSSLGAVQYFAGNGDGTFASATGLGSGIVQEIADFNGDGFLDIFKISSAFSEAALLYGNGDGSFQAASSFGTTVSPVSGVGDFNGDGSLDITVLDSGSFAVYLNDGAGTFSLDSTFESLGPSDPIIVDLDGDGDLDLVGTRSPTFGVRLNNGDGTFAVGTSFTNLDTGYGSLLILEDFNGDGVKDFVNSVPNTGITRIRLAESEIKTFAGGDALTGAQETGLYSSSAFDIGDVNDDGFDDLLVTNDETVFIHLGKGDGSFYKSGVAIEPAGINPLTDLNLVDFDNDGDLDLHLEDSLNRVIVAMNDGAGSFTVTENEDPDVLTGFQRLGDFDGDGLTDIFSYEGGGSGYLKIWFNNGDGTFGFSSTSSYSISNESFQEIADFNGDGRDDIALADTASGELKIYFSNGDGTFLQSSTVSGLVGPNFVVGGDIDGDSDSDLVLRVGLDYYVYKNDGVGAFSLETTFSSEGGVSERLIDYDGDGDLDLFGYDAEVLQFFENDGTGNYTLAFTSQLNSATSLDFAFVDADRDGALEIFSADISDRIRRSEFVANEVTTLNPTGDGGNDSLLVGDFNGDGNDDLVSVNTFENSLSLRLGNGDGTFAAEATFATGVGPQEIAAADINADGVLDILVTNKDSGTVGIFIGNGDGSFASQSTVFVGNKPVGLSLGDFDGDGNIDFATAVKNDGELKIYSGNGSGGFTQSSVIDLNEGIYDVSVAAFDGNEAHDLVVTNRETGEISLLKNNGSGVFSFSSTLYGGTLLGSVRVEDLNGDTYDDIVVVDEGLNELRVFLGNGDSSFDSAVTYAGVYNPDSVSIADVDGDDILDLVVSSSPVVGGLEFEANYDFILKGNGDGSFQAATTIDANRNGGSVIVSDIDNDLDDDLIFYDLSNNDIEVLLGQGGGNVVEPSTYVFEVQTNYEDLLNRVDEALVEVEEARRSVGEAHSRLELIYGEQVGLVGGGIDFLSDQALPAAIQSGLEGSDLLALTDFVAREIRQQAVAASDLYNPLDLSRVTQLLDSLF